MDPLAHKMPKWSPYGYAFNDPSRFSDPTGAVPRDEIRLECCRNGSPQAVFNKALGELEGLWNYFNDAVVNPAISATNHFISEPIKQHPEDIKAVRSVKESQTGQQATDTKWLGNTAPEFNPEATAKGEGDRNNVTMVAEGGMRNVQGGDPRENSKIQEVDNMGNKAPEESYRVISGGMRTFGTDQDSLFKRAVSPKGDTVFIFDKVTNKRGKVRPFK